MSLDFRYQSFPTPKIFGFHLSYFTQPQTTHRMNPGCTRVVFKIPEWSKVILKLAQSQPGSAVLYGLSCLTAEISMYAGCPLQGLWTQLCKITNMARLAARTNVFWTEWVQFFSAVAIPSHLWMIASVTTCWFLWYCLVKKVSCIFGFVKI